MIELIGYVFMVLPWLLAVAMPLAAMLALVLGRRTAGWWVAAYYVLLFCIPNNSYGLLDPLQDRNFYSRGTGTFFFSAINVLLFGLALQAFFARRFAHPIQVRHNLGVPALLLGLMMAGNVLVFTQLPEVRWFTLFGNSGLLHFMNFMLAFYVLVSALRAPEDLRRFVDLFLACVVLRGLWGLVRFAVLGGDPANFYSNFQSIDVRLTFFDINDSLLAAMALFLAMWRLAHGDVQRLWPRLALWAVVALELFIIVFSYRRTAWGGLALVALLLAFSLRGRWRWGLLAGFALGGLPLLAYKMVVRGTTQARGGSLLERMLPDIIQGGQLNFSTGRFAELYAAWLTLKHDWVLGLGVWGQYDGFRFSELTWHRGDFSWMHSGLMHVWLKFGIVGVAIVLAATWLYVRFVWQQQRQALPPQRGMVLLGAAGAVFLLPTLLIGTPLIEFRTMQLLALCVALPYIAAKVGHVGSAVAPVASQGQPRRWVFGIRPMPLQPNVLQPWQRN